MSEQQRFAIYTRYSSDMQNEISLEAQEHSCRQAIADRDGIVVQVFSDSAKSGWSLDRDGFNALRKAAEKGKFDAIMFWKFDRLARNHNHVVMIKTLLRHEYELKLFCVEGFSEDDDSEYAAMMEQMIAIFSAFYSRNLSTETKRGKLRRAERGLFNGSTAPLGYDLITSRRATYNKPEGLYVNPEIAPIIKKAFEIYSEGKYSDRYVANWFNDQPAIQRIRANQKPIGKEMVRDLLKNRVYTGRVSYTETQYSGSMGEGKRSTRNRKRWFEGQHEPIISDELYDRCQQARAKRVRTRTSTTVTRTYILADKVYCADCLSKDISITDAGYGKMRPKRDARVSDGYYRCTSRDRGYFNCKQPGMLISVVDDVVINLLMKLHIPDEYRERVEQAVHQKVEQAQALQRMKEIEAIVKRIDFSWERGFIAPEEYAEKREQLQREMDVLQPITHDDIRKAARILDNFQQHWYECRKAEDVNFARQQLLDSIISRVLVHDKKVIGVTLRGGFNIASQNTYIPFSMRHVLSNDI